MSATNGPISYPNLTYSELHGTHRRLADELRDNCMTDN